MREYFGTRMRLVGFECPSKNYFLGVVLTMMTIDAIKPPKAVPEWIEDGIAVVTKTVRPTM